MTPAPEGLSVDWTTALEGLSVDIFQTSVSARRSTHSLRLSAAGQLSLSHYSRQFYPPPTRLSTNGMSHSAFDPQPQRITTLRPVLISRPTEGRRLSWPGWLVAYGDGMPARRRSPIPGTNRPIVRRPEIDH